MRRRQERDDPAACNQAPTQKSDHRFSFRLGINFLRRYYSRRRAREHSKRVRHRATMVLLCNGFQDDVASALIPAKFFWPRDCLVSASIKSDATTCLWFIRYPL